MYKRLVHGGKQPHLFHYREARGPEIDLIVEKDRDLLAMEMKSGATINRDFFKNLDRFLDHMAKSDSDRRIDPYLVYGGDDDQKRSNTQILSWRHLHRVNF